MQRRRADCHHSTAEVVDLRAVRRVYSKKKKKNTLLEQNLHNCSTYRPVAGKSERSTAQPQNSCQGNKGKGSTGACQRPWKITVEGGAVVVVVVNAAAGGEPFSHVSNVTLLKNKVPVWLPDTRLTRSRWWSRQRLTTARSRWKSLGLFMLQPTDHWPH